MTPLEQAVDAASRAYVSQTTGNEFDDLAPFQRFGVREYVATLVAPAIKAYEEAKASGSQPELD